MLLGESEKSLWRGGDGPEVGRTGEQAEAECALCLQF